MTDTVKRRLDLLKLEGQGFSQSEIVKGLSKEYTVTKRTVRYDFQKRSTWQPKLMELDDPQKMYLRVVNRYEEIYRMAAFKYRTATNDSVQLGALNTMTKANEKLAEIQLPDIQHQTAPTVTPNIHVHMWRPDHAVSRE